MLAPVGEKYDGIGVIESAGVQGPAVMVDVDVKRGNVVGPLQRPLQELGITVPFVVAFTVAGRARDERYFFFRRAGSATGVRRALQAQPRRYSSATGGLTIALTS